ncbi:hypothetical protein [Nesterenkonia lutea]|uniref:Flp family type IVb pilin n=1 Tax=Nesterenkonia lutea TaxID=272919 RepID=A0ABR9JEC8_9MICC|nr:hypothetical protein [Nesterenkonia lutea]MBE1524285.1 hypothetical protein [Nesterenkonia lutea]
MKGTTEPVHGMVLTLLRLEAEERGDVPGWVMITLMSAVLVAGLLAIAQPALQGLFNDAINQVSR